MPKDLSLPSPSGLPGGARPARGGPSIPLTRPQKAAVIVRLLIAEGIDVALDRLPDDVQVALGEAMTGLKPVSQATIDAVVEEFLGEIDEIGLQFPDRLDRTLALVGDRLTPTAAARLRAEAGVDFEGDPWEVLREVDEERLVPLIEAESVEVAAVILSKLRVATAAAVLGKLPGALARRIAYAVSKIGAVSPDTVRRIGVSLSEELGARPVRAFDEGPVARVGAILNSSTAGTRDDVLAGLEEADRIFAEEVRRAIFTFANIPGRVAPRDVPRVIREIDQRDLVTALAGATGKDAAAAEFLLANISQRMADSIRAEAAERGQVAQADAESAMTAIVTVIRTLEADGEIFLTVEDE